MDVAVLFSGGKDSTYALDWSLKRKLNVRYLVSIKPRNQESYMFHVPCVDLTRLQAESVGIPLVHREVSGVKEKEVDELGGILKKLNVEGIVSGAIASNYQKSRVDGIARILGIKHLAPLWGTDPEGRLREMVDNGFKIMVVGVSAYGLDRSWLGRILDRNGLEELKSLGLRYGIHIAGEGGEFETLVVDAPLFRKELALEFEKKWSKQSGYILVKKAKLVKK